MSKRFGRNQKKALRRQIEDLEFNLSDAENNIKQLKDSAYFNQLAVDDTLEVLGEYFCTLPDKSSIEVQEAINILKICTQNTPLTFAQRDAGAAGKLMEVLSLPILRYGIHNDKIRDMVYVEVTDRYDLRVGMAISGDAIRYMSKSSLSDNIKRTMSKGLAEELKRVGYE